MEEKEFSFGYYFLYALRHGLIVLLCVVVGVALGLVHSLTYSTTHYEAYSGNMKFILSEYAEIMFPSLSTIQQGDSDICTQQLTQIVETARDTKVMAKTFAENKNSIYSGLSEKEKLERFYTDFTIEPGTYSFTVGFVYDVNSQSEREAVKKIVADYFVFALENVKTVYPEFEGDEYASVINIGEVERNYDFENTDEIFESNEKPSMVISILIGGILGVAVSAVILLIMYLLDRHVKSVKNLLSPQQAEIINADEDGSVIKFIAKLQVSDANRVLISSSIPDEGFDAWASELCNSLHLGNSKIKFVAFSESVLPDYVERGDWKTFDGKEEEGMVIYLYNNMTPGVLCYLANRVDGVALLLDQKNTSEKAFTKAIEDTKATKYICTVLHNVTNTYLD